jgi:hypothetical protein
MGALKTSLYAGLFAVLEPSPWTVCIPSLLAGSDAVFVQHVQDKQMIHGVNDRLAKWLSKLGFVCRSNKIIPGRNGRPGFEIFRFGSKDD